MAEILLPCGSVRAGSGNETMLRTVADVAAASGSASTVRYQGLDTLPHFNPDLDADPLPPAVADLRPAVARADALLICVETLRMVLEYTDAVVVPEACATIPCDRARQAVVDGVIADAEVRARLAVVIDRLLAAVGQVC